MGYSEISSGHVFSRKLRQDYKGLYEISKDKTVDYFISNKKLDLWTIKIHQILKKAFLGV